MDYLSTYKVPIAVLATSAVHCVITFFLLGESLTYVIRVYEFNKEARLEEAEERIRQELREEFLSKLEK